MLISPHVGPGELSSPGLAASAFTAEPSVTTQDLPCKCIFIFGIWNISVSGLLEQKTQGLTLQIGSGGGETTLSAFLTEVT